MPSNTMENEAVINPDNKNLLAAGSGKVLQYFKNGLIFYWSSFFLLILIEFLLGGQLSKILTKENYSLYVNVLNTLPFYSVLLNVGLSYGLVYLIASHPAIKFTLFRQALQTQTIWYFILLGIHILLFFFFRNLFVVALMITLLISYTYSYKLNINSFFLATGAYHKAALSNLLQKAVLLLLFIIAFRRSGLAELLNAQFTFAYPAIELGVVFLYFLLFWQTNFKSIRASKVNYRKRMFKYGKYAMLNNGLSMLYYTIVAFVIASSHIDVHLKIILGLCFMFFRYTGVAIAPVISVISPQLTRNKNDLPSIKKLYKKYFIVILAISLLTLVLCRFLFGGIITYFYARSYADLPGYFYFFVYLIPFSLFNSFHATVLAALGKIKYTFKTEVLCTILLFLFLIYNLWLPAVDYHFFYYIIFVHLIVKFSLQTYGYYSIFNKK